MHDARTDAGPLALPARLDQKAVPALIDALRSRRGDDLIIDADGCVHVGSKAAQTLLVARATWSADGRALAIRNIAETCVEQLRLLGLAPSSFETGPAA